MPDAVISWLLQQGWPGLLIIVLTGALVFMVREDRARNTALRDENLELRKFIRELQDKRATEIQAVAAVSTKTIGDFTAKAEALLDIVAQRGRK